MGTVCRVVSVGLQYPNNKGPNILSIGCHGTLLLLPQKWTCCCEMLSTYLMFEFCHFLWPGQVQHTQASFWSFIMVVTVLVYTIYHFPCSTFTTRTHNITLFCNLSNSVLAQNPILFCLSNEPSNLNLL